MSWQQTSNCRRVNDDAIETINRLRLLKRILIDLLQSIDINKFDRFVTINWYKQNLIMLLLLWLNTIWIDKKNWRIKVTKKQKNILHDKYQIDFLNNRYLNNRRQKRMLHNKCVYSLSKMSINNTKYSMYLFIEHNKQKIAQCVYSLSTMSNEKFALLYKFSKHLFFKRYIQFRLYFLN